ncbi:glycosyltransferase [Buchananella hordeovulneris]|uniref:glycosyltransferase n=1 Tax=Buchananella hordeovulneris TaxID=52770 RepID=UPI000F5E69E0|nr:glycosyltransferase [Buchananella hordeovulneris]RRD44529.1 glycosyltransferase [Buchananella hordeovulneris]
MGERIVAVVVAYNRRELLTQVLAKLAAQTRPVDALVVVDNASSDGSGEVARTHPAVTEVVTLPRNTGGAGGFTAGIARAVAQHAADYVWIMDDDTLPTPTALAELLAAKARYGGSPALLASKAVWTDGTEHPMNTPRPRPFLARAARLRAARAGVQHVRTASFVSILLDARAIAAVGLPRAGYFLWNDDFEYTAALLRGRTGLFVPDSVVVHATKVLGDSSADPGDRFEWEVRNKLWALRSRRSFEPLERVAYAGASVLRWVRTLAKSPDPARLRRVGAVGLRAGLAPAPATPTVLADTPVAGDVLHVESLRLPSAPPPPAARVERRGGRALPGACQLVSGVSVLVSTYLGDDAEQLRRALRSVTVEQTCPPSELVLVTDGPLRPEVEEVVADLGTRSRTDPVAGLSVTLVRLAANLGLARALSAGLAHCRYDVVVRQDADDISLPTRLATQLPLIAAGKDLVGSAIAEFETDPAEPGMIRRYPQSQADIARLMRRRDPFNHPSVVYRRSVVEQVGGYQHLALMEDYWLFARMVAAGAAAANVPEALVAYRVGEGAYRRRGGWKLLVSEVRMQSKLWQLGIVTWVGLLFNLATRGGYRLVPTGLRRRVYALLTRRGGQ